MKKSLKLFIMLILSICILHICSNAQSFVFETDIQEKVAEPGENIEIKLSVKDIKDIEDGINTVIGYLDYEDNLFETVDFVGKDKWKVTYNNDKNNKLYGKFAIITLQKGILQEEQIATLNVKLKGNLPDGETEIKFNSISSSDGYNTISEKDKIIKLIIKNKESDVKNEGKKPDENTTNNEENRNNNKNTTNNKGNGKPQNILTGDNVYVYFIVIVVVVIINVFVYIILKKKKKNKDNDNKEE